MMHLLLLSLLVAPCSGQLMYYYLYPSYYPTTPALQYPQSPAYTTQQQYICGTPPNYQYQSTPCTSFNYNAACERECQSTPYCQRFDAAATCVNGCCNSTQPTPNSNFYNPSPNNQNSNGIARDNGNNINDVTCPFNDPSAGSCIDGNCPSGFVCNQENVCCPCAVGAAQGACSAGSCSSSALRCESASGMCCPRPMNGSASAGGASGSPYGQLQYTQGLQQQQQQHPQQQYGNQQFQQQQQQNQYPQQQIPLEPYPPQYPQQGGQFQQQSYGRQQQPQFNFNDQQSQNQYQQSQQRPDQFNFDSQNQNQFQQPQSQQNLQQGNQYRPQQSQQYNTNTPNQFQPQQSNQQFNGQQQPNQSPNQFQRSQTAQNPTTPFVYNTQNPNPTFSPVSPQVSTTTIPTIYPSSG